MENLGQYDGNLAGFKEINETVDAIKSGKLILILNFITLKN